MFRRLQTLDNSIEFDFEGRTILASPHDSVAAALLAAGIIEFRRSEAGDELRGPYCMIGNCFECLVEIDGRPNQQACRHRVRDGMKVAMQRGIRRGGGDAGS